MGHRPGNDGGIGWSDRNAIRLFRSAKTCCHRRYFTCGPDSGRRAARDDVVAGRQYAVKCLEWNDRSRQPSPELFVRFPSRFGAYDLDLDRMGRAENVPVGEYHALVLFTTFGMLLMASGNDMVVIFLGLETVSIATYVLAGLRKSDLRSNESAMKYFILGSFASAFLLYGMSLIYGATGSTNLTEIAARIAAPNFPALLLIGAAMMIVGFGFKAALVPFHVWTPDVYEGAPTPISGFMAAGPKAAAFASFVRVFVLGFPLIAGAQASGYLHETWMSALAIIAMFSMTLGNVAAIMQNNVKRMLAYSSIAHAGYAVVGFLGAGAAKTQMDRSEAIASVAFYMLTYAITNLGAFAVVALVAQKNDRRADFEDYNGIGFKSPLLSFTLAIFMLSLLGLPLTAGFMGKVLVFRPALQTGNTLLTIVVVAAVVNTAISAYYYLRLIVVMYFRERTTEWTEPKMPAGFAAAL